MKLFGRYLPLVAVLVVGTYFRMVIGLYWDLDQHLHPDERFLTMVTERIEIPSSVGLYFDSGRSPLSPYNQDFSFFVYGTLPIFLTKYISTVVGMANYGSIHIVGRVLSSLFDLLTILAVFLLGKRLFSAQVGLVAAVLLALCAQNVQLSHFFGVENFTSFFVLLSFLLAVGFVLPREKLLCTSPWYSRAVAGVCLVALPALSFIGGLPLYVSAQLCLIFAGVMFSLVRQGDLGTVTRFSLVGFSFGLALSCKVSSVFCLPFLVLPFGVVFFRSAFPLFSQRIMGETSIPTMSINRIILGTLLFCAISAATFRTFQPYAFGGTSFFSFSFGERFLSNMREVSGLMIGADVPPSVQWAHRTPVFFMLKNMFWWQMGIPLFIAMWFGVAWIAWSALVRPRIAEIMCFGWAAFWFCYSSVQFVKAGRYLSIAYPFFTLAAAVALVGSTIWLKKCAAQTHWGRLQKATVPYLPLILTVVGSFLWIVATTNIYRFPHSRIAASRWIYENIPCGSVIANEHWDDGLPLRVDGRDGFGGCYKGREFEHYHPDNPQKLQKTLQILDDADYIVLSSNRLYMSIPRLPRRFPFTIEYYKMLFSGELGFSLQKIFSSYPHLYQWEFNDDDIEETVTVYDHPKVLIFKKGTQYDSAYVAKKLSAFAHHENVTLQDQQK